MYILEQEIQSPCYLSISLNGMSEGLGLGCGQKYSSSPPLQITTTTTTKRVEDCHTLSRVLPTKKKPYKRAAVILCPCFCPPGRLNAGAWPSLILLAYLATNTMLCIIDRI
jgi:hypothetical protein